MPAGYRKLWTVLALASVVFFAAEAKSREIKITGPGGESSHGNNQVLVYSCTGKLHRCKVSSAPAQKRSKNGYTDDKGRFVVPKYHPPAAAANPKRHYRPRRR